MDSTTFFLCGPGAFSIIIFTNELQGLIEK